MVWTLNICQAIDCPYSSTPDSATASLLISPTRATTRRLGDSLVPKASWTSPVSPWKPVQLNGMQHSTSPNCWSTCSSIYGRLAQNGCHERGLILDNAPYPTGSATDLLDIFDGNQRTGSLRRLQKVLPCSIRASTGENYYLQGGSPVGQFSDLTLEIRCSNGKLLDLVALQSIELS